MKAIVYGLGIAGRSTVRALAARGYDVVATDDRLGNDVRASVEALGGDVVEAADAHALLAEADLVVPAPGVPETHPFVLAAQDRNLDVASEIELAYRFEQDRAGGPRPLLAVTGTDGKTTTTLLACEILRAAGRDPVAAGNTEVPLLDAIDLNVDCFVVEATSFRLAWTAQFRADAAAWLNLAEDHLNWHRSMASYEAAKARIFALQRATDVAVGFADDEVVLRHLHEARGVQRTFAATAGDYRVADGWLVGPSGGLAAVDAMRRKMPHDLTNALAAAALALELQLATADSVAAAVAAFSGPPHRLEDLGRHAGVRWFNDSKATTPHAASVALAAFDRVVLIAGGLNKGLDLTPMAAQAGHVVAVVAIGRDAGDIEKVFVEHCPVVRADDMASAVTAAAELAAEGETVLLSPGCASFDWYPDGGFAARGDDFRTYVDRLDPVAVKGASA